MDHDTTRLSPAEVDAYYERLVTLYWQQLNAFILRRIGNLQDTEDIVQEAFIRAYYALERYTLQRLHTLQVRPWLYKITWNVYLNHIRHIRPSVVLSLDVPEGDLLLDLDDEWQQQPEMIFERGEQRCELERLIKTLPDPYREVIILYYFDELGQQEIADLLNRPLGTIKTHIYRGLRLLKKAWQAQEERSAR